MIRIKYIGILIVKFNLYHYLRFIMKQKINKSLFESAQKYALELQHPAFLQIHKQSYEYMSQISCNITKKFYKVLVHGSYPETMLRFLGQDIPQIQFVGYVDPNFILPKNVKIINEQDAQKKQYDAIFSSMKCQFDFLKKLKYYKNMLIPDGALIASTWTQKNLEEIRWAYLLAQNQRSGGISPKIFNFPILGSIGHHLVMEKYNLSTIMTRRVQLQLQSVVDLITLFQVTGQSGYLHGKRKGVYKDVLLAMSALYDSQFYEQNRKCVKASLQMGIFIGWKQDSSQPKALRRGQQVNMDFIDKLKEEDPGLKTYSISQDSQYPKEIK